MNLSKRSLVFVTASILATTFNDWVQQPATHSKSAAGYYCSPSTSTASAGSMRQRPQIQGQMLRLSCRHPYYRRRFKCRSARSGDSQCPEPSEIQTNGE